MEGADLLESADLVGLVLHAAGLHSMCAAAAVCQLWHQYANSQALWARFCDDRWPGMRVALASNDSRSLCKKMLESERTPAEVEPADILVYIECRGWLEAPIISPLAATPYREDVGHGGHLLTVPGIGNAASLALLEEHADVSIRLIQRSSGKVAYLKRAGDVWNDGILWDEVDGQDIHQFGHVFWPPAAARSVRR